MNTDTLFAQPITKQFEFDAAVASVFDDMLARSIPFYDQVQDLTIRFALPPLAQGGRVYDLGSSTASLLLALERHVPPSTQLIGIDSSSAMIEHARKKLIAYNSHIELIEGDIVSFAYEPCDVVLCQYTLQFVRPLQREGLIRRIAEALREGGLFIFSEKVISDEPTLDKALIECYYDFKKSQGYSEYEIVQKREALENVLIPYTMGENIHMLTTNGFRGCDLLFRWANFATFIAWK